MKRVATGLASSVQADPELAAHAVEMALRSLDASVASSVLLLLTSEFAHDPQPAIRAAARAASCIQVMGCSAPGIFTEQDWIIDAPAAAAMVFTGATGLQASIAQQDQQMLLALTAPNALDTNWLAMPGLRFGGVSGDALGRGPFSVWQNSKGVANGHCEAVLTGVHGVARASHGLRLLSQPQLVTQVEEHQLQLLDQQSALFSLEQAYPMAETPVPLHLLMVAFADSPQAIAAGDYQVSTLLCTNQPDASVTISRLVQPGQYLCWAIRDVDAAQGDLQHTVRNLDDALGTAPEFGLMFSNLGRGPYFYNGVDKDLEILRQQFPDMPLIGFYGNGEIAPLRGISQLLQYSVVVALFAATASGSEH